MKKCKLQFAFHLLNLPAQPIRPADLAICLPVAWLVYALTPAEYLQRYDANECPKNKCNCPSSIPWLDTLQRIN